MTSLSSLMKIFPETVNQKKKKKKETLSLSKKLLTRNLTVAGMGGTAMRALNHQEFHIHPLG